MERRRENQGDREREGEGVLGATLVRRKLCAGSSID